MPTTVDFATKVKDYPNRMAHINALRVLSQAAFSAAQSEELAAMRVWYASSRDDAAEKALQAATRAAWLKYGRLDAAYVTAMQRP